MGLTIQNYTNTEGNNPMCMNWSKNTFYQENTLWNALLDDNKVEIIRNTSSKILYETGDPLILWSM